MLPFQHMEQDAIARGYTRVWQKKRAGVFHIAVDGKLIWPGQQCEYRWDGSGYDPGYEFRRIAKTMEEG